MNKLARNTLALGTATVIVTAAVSFSANGADATKSYSAGRFLTGSIGSTNLDSVAQLRGETAANPGNIGANKNNLDLTVLSSIPVKVPGGVNLDVAKLLSPQGAAGAISQYASAESTKKAVGASGAVSDSGAVLTTNGGVPANAKLSLVGGQLPGINPALASVDLGVGALSSNTTVENGAPTTRAYQIGGLNLQVGVPLIGSLVGSLSDAVAPLAPASSISLSLADVCPLLTTTANVTISALIAQLDTLAPGVGTLVGTVLDPTGLNGSNQIDLCTVAGLTSSVPGAGDALDDLVKVKVTGLDKLTTSLSNISSGGVDVDVSTGKITLDLAQILSAANIDINKLPPNTDLLKYLTTGLINDKITAVIDKVVNDLVTNLGNVNIEVTLAGTVVPVDLDDLTGQLVPPLVGLLNTATDGVKQLGAPIDSALADLVPNLNQIIKLTANNQSTSKTPTLGTGTVNAGSTKGSISSVAVGDYYRTSALKIDVLSNTLNIDIAASEAATLAADPPVDGAVAAADDSDAPADNGDGSDSVSDGADANADNGDDSDTVADADAQADADVTTALPSTGAPNLLPFWLLGIALLLFGGAVLLNEKRRLNQV